MFRVLRPEHVGEGFAVDAHHRMDSTELLVGPHFDPVLLDGTAAGLQIDIDGSGRSLGDEVQDPAVADRGDRAVDDPVLSLRQDESDGQDRDRDGGQCREPHRRSPQRRSARGLLRRGNSICHRQQLGLSARSSSTSGSRSVIDFFQLEVVPQRLQRPNEPHLRRLGRHFQLRPDLRELRTTQQLQHQHFPLTLRQPRDTRSKRRRHIGPVLTLL